MALKRSNSCHAHRDHAATARSHDPLTKCDSPHPRAIARRHDHSQVRPHDVDSCSTVWAATRDTNSCNGTRPGLSATLPTSALYFKDETAKQVQYAPAWPADWSRYLWRS